MIEARIRFGAAGRKKFQVESEARKTALQDMARLLMGANVDPDFAKKLVGDAAQASDVEFEKLKRVAAVAAEPTSNVVKPAPVKAGSPSETVAAYAERWFDQREVRGLSSVEGDRGRFKLHIVPTLGAGLVASVSANDVRGLVEVLDGKVRRSELHWQTAKKLWGFVTKLFDDACESKVSALRVRADNPCRDVRGPDAGEPTAKQWLYPVEVSALLACEEVPLRWRRLYALATYLYLRTGELAALEWADVDSVRGFVNVHQALDLATGKLKSTKTGVTRKVPIHPSLAPLLAALRAESGGVGLVVQNPHEQRTQPHGLPPKERLATSLREHLQLKAKVDRAELYADRATTKRITFYDLRATGITWEVLAGTEHVRVQQRAGHKHFATTALYIREAETLGVAVGEPFPPLPASLLGQGEGPGPSGPEDPAGPTAGPIPGPMVTQVTETKRESSEPHGLFEALGVGEHVHVGEHVRGGLRFASCSDVSELFDRWVFVAGFVACGARQPVVGDFTLRETLMQRIACGEGVRLFSQVVRVVGLPGGAWLEHDGVELLAHALEEVAQRGAIGAAAREVWWSDEDRSLGLELLGDLAQRLQRGLDDLAFAKALLGDLAWAQERKLEASRRLSAPAPDGARTWHGHVRLLHLDEKVLFEIARRWNSKSSAANDHHDWRTR